MITCGHQRCCSSGRAINNVRPHYNRSAGSVSLAQKRKAHKIQIPERIHVHVCMAQVQQPRTMPSRRLHM